MARIGSGRPDGNCAGELAGPMSELVERLLEERERKDRWARSMEVIGKFSSGLTDVSVNHDKYLAEAYS